ncbi:hypothetical protein SO802_007774 [Lithocarpus litseifolius]|uniref:DUF4283 domain-containing protein n=1 Tax=Lithocarpus litseifolius TaxID=425828 RepID=A0AAW2DVA3_9ROSI
MAEEISKVLEKMNLTAEEEETIAISDEGHKEELESCALSLIGKFLTCRPFNKKAAQITLKKAWGLEEKVQIFEVGSNLFQFKFKEEFDLNRVFTGGPWSFDNQALLLTKWEVGMTATNVRFESVPLWVQIWGAPFDMRTPKVAKEIGERLGKVLEVEERRYNNSQNFFMRVKVEIPVAKAIRRGAFLAGSDGLRHWVDLKYERLPLFCHFCGILGHDLRHCAQYFSQKKDGKVAECGYGEWLKAVGGRARSPLKREAGVGMKETQNGHQQSGVVEEGSGAGKNLTEMASENEKGKSKIVGDDNVISGERGANNGKVGADKESRDFRAQTFDASVSNSNVVTDLIPTAQGSHVQIIEAESGSGEGKKQPKWTRLVRMDYGPVELLKEGAKSILGKRSLQPMYEEGLEDSQHSAAKRGKVEDDSTTMEAAGVLQHPCREQ